MFKNTVFYGVCVFEVRLHRHCRLNTTPRIVKNTAYYDAVLDYLWFILETYSAYSAYSAYNVYSTYSVYST